MISKAQWVAKAQAALVAGEYNHAMFARAAAPVLIQSIAATIGAQKARRGKRKLCALAQITTAAPLTVVPAHSANGPRQYLANYLRLLAHLNKAPWASGVFDANSAVLMRLVAAHLPLIIGEENPDPGLYSMLDGSGSMHSAQNVVWITNRQQGKTTLIGKFLASLVLTARCGGVLACVYSTKMDRAAELLKAAKEYLTWMQTPAGDFPNFPPVVFTGDNQRQFTVQVGTNFPVTVQARPRNADACRGDAPAAAFFDEIAFTSAQFWYQFALPLLQVAGRRFTCTTTPPPPGSFFDNFCKEVKSANAKGDTFFFLINHSLACDQCIERLEPDRCCHKLYLVPPWKSLISLNAIGRLMPKARAADFVAEVFGVLRSTFTGYLPGDLVSRTFVSGPRANEPLCCMPDRVVWIAIDPCSHRSSEMGLAAIMSGGGNGVALIGAASVSGERCQISQLQATVALFAERVRAHPWVGQFTVLIPIIECNNNEIFAASLLSALTPHGPLFVPFTEQRFKKFITPGVGIWTSEATTIAALSTVYQCLIEKTIHVSKHVVTVGREAFDTRAHTPDPNAAVKLLADQLCQFSDNEKGKVTGKTADGLQDDLGMALLLAVYWRLATIAADPTINA
jgi:hypothetical protein